MTRRQGSSLTWIRAIAVVLAVQGIALSSAFSLSPSRLPSLSHSRSSATCCNARKHIRLSHALVVRCVAHRREVEGSQVHHRQFVPLGSSSDDKDCLSLLSYNVLGPKQALTEKHNYASLRHRKWPYRKKQLLEEIERYNPDILCLQEITPDTFQHDFTPFLKELGLDSGVYTPKKLPVGEVMSNGKRVVKRKPRPILRPDLLGTGSHACLGTATFFRSSVLKLLKCERVLLRSKLSTLCDVLDSQEAVSNGQSSELSGETEGDESTKSLTRRARRRQRGKTRLVPPVDSLSMSLASDVRGKADTAVFTCFELKGKEGQGAVRRLGIANVHLFWDPQRPDIKLIQCALACSSFSAFMKEVQDQHGEQKTPLILSGDFNSVRHLQTEFLRNLSQENQEEFSAVWRLMAKGSVDASHPEHPSSFGSSVDMPSIANNLPTLQNAYTAGGRELPKYTTKTGFFAGCIDHIWCTQDVQVQSILEMPYTESDSANFPPIPDATWGSDHLAIGARFKLPDL
ncbi:hypothetical protein GUITHDRAFT_101167 [Guillardia theta CCMP2712]|uniref:Endonuclease/exonuclease/phosphatase domain-containing protein n=1 Tax=Guillardia theta (strain CCMP2712) TaxID=905079 RepID=L1JY19_GUITC|nr:hypothetical protein GUITHDRAFT_101167 [Guillardia theta CCMP2712]EKX53466.1 hypothetical protein GUITHDRAFT_101167 [Guillardia theta CCMP2712]|eukprot:XP_005840446.1 hypothetical protein GUITHDRAFT_101167 [Guillardia theta CCMP2712]